MLKTSYAFQRARLLQNALLCVTLLFSSFSFTEVMLCFWGAFNAVVEGIVFSHSCCYWERSFSRVQPKCKLIESPSKELINEETDTLAIHLVPSCLVCIDASGKISSYGALSISWKLHAQLSKWKDGKILLVTISNCFWDSVWIS